MSVFNWFDFILILLLLVGMAVGYVQGLVRQVIGIAALYIGLVLATQFFQGASRMFGNLIRQPPNTLTNAVTFFLILLVAATLINYLGIDAYKATRIKVFPMLDHLIGMLLGLGSMWIIITIVVNVLAFAVSTQGWGGNAELARLLLENGLGNSKVAEITVSTLPMIVSSIRPWLPSGMPAIFNL